ncbi:MAG: FtsW/RodA/SpoVE family cell cycle protein [Candidatus Bathyarchaeota archaeon]|nr:FtsW/RodA/SpoVE family cell cycle protein [Candidatus Bathyarchaeota archaeon]
MNSYLRKFDWWLLLFAILLTTLGLSLLASLSLNSQEWSFFRRQFTFLVIGIIIAILIPILDIKALKEGSLFIFVLYSVSLILLGGLFFLAEPIRGTRAWYTLGTFTFEPVEITKIIFILFFAKYFSQRHVELYQARHIFLSVLYAILPATLVFFQPDFGSAIILVLLWLSMLLVAGIKRTHLLIILTIGLMSLVIVWSLIFTGEQKERFVTFLNPYIDPTGSGYHILQSIIAVGSGGITGKGFFEPLTQAKLGFLPEAHTDFIFATLSEIFGLVGIGILFFVLILFFWRLFRFLKVCQDNFSRLLVAGFIILIGAETFINIAMNIGLLPITGIPLAFLSYGGSSLLSLFIGIGIIESIRIHSSR